MVPNAPGWTLPPAISQHPKLSIACGEAPWLIQLCRTVDAKLEEPFAVAGMCMPAWAGVPSKPRAPLQSSGVLAAPQTWGPTCTQLLRGDISLLSRLRGGCPCVLLAIWHVPQSQEALPQRAVSWNAVAPPRELFGGCCPPVTSHTFLLFLFFSVGQVVNIKAKVNRAFNSSMEVGVCPCPCPPCCVPIPTSKIPKPSHSSQL